MYGGRCTVCSVQSLSRYWRQDRFFARMLVAAGGPTCRMRIGSVESVLSSVQSLRMLQHFVLYCITLYYIVLHCIILYYIVLYCIIISFHVVLFMNCIYCMVVFIVWLYLLYGCIYCMYWIYCVYCVYCMECMWFVNPLTRRSAGSRAALIC